MVLEYYYDNLSQPCRAVYLFLKGTGVEFEPKPLQLLKGEHRGPELVKLNPFTKVPFIVDDGFVLSESVAIMRYIAEKYNVPDHWFPRKDAKQAAKHDQFLSWYHLCLRKHGIDIFVETIRTRIGVGRFPKKPLDKVKVGAAKEELAKSIDQIADHFLKDQPFICGNEISAADLIGVNEIIHMSGINESALYEKNATVNAWIQRVADRMAPHYEEALKNLKMLNKMFNESTSVEEDNTDGKLEYYYDNLSQPCRAVYLFLKGTGVDFESKPLELIKGDQRQPEILKLNPFGKVPFINDGGFVLTESVAILRYIAEKYSVPDHWFPRKDAKQAAKHDQFLSWYHLCLRKHGVTIFLETIRTRIGLADRLPKKPLDKAKVAEAKEELTKALNQIADYFLKDQPYICGDEISAADLIGVNEIIHISGVNEGALYEKNTTVNAWIKRVADRMAPHYDEALKNLKMMNKVFNDSTPVEEDSSDVRL